MHSTLHPALASWSVPWIPTLAIAITALLYLRGWYLLRCAGFPLLPPWRVWAFLAGLFSLWIALAGPMDVFNSWLLTAHMIQHMVLMMVAPPLILLGAPLIPVVRGMPVFAAREFAGPFLNWRPAQRLGRLLTQPVFALVLMGVVMLGWHVPALYELAVRSPAWHQFEHTCFLVASLIFWWPVIQPWPSLAQWPHWAMVPYLIVADLQNTVLSATLVFAERVLYPSYIKAPRVFGLPARQDQAAAGAIMWVVGSVAFLIPALLIAVQCLTARATPAQAQRLTKRRPLLAGIWQRATSKLGLSTRNAGVLSFLALFAAAGLIFSVALASSGSDEDELALRAQQRAGDLMLSVYTSADQLVVGENRISFLVQDAAGSPVLDAQVEVSASREGAASSNEIHGLETDSDNKLLRSETIQLPATGAWLVGVDVNRGSQTASLTFPAQAVVHTPGLDDWWPYLIFPACGLLLLLIYLHGERPRQPMAHEQVEHATASD